MKMKKKDIIEEMAFLLQSLEPYVKLGLIDEKLLKSMAEGFSSSTEAKSYGTRCR